MDKNIYLITLTENVKYNDIVTARKHKGVVIGDYRKACELQKKNLYDRLHYWMDKWGYTDDYTLEEIFEVAKGLNKISAWTENGDEFLCYVEVVDEF